MNKTDEVANSIPHLAGIIVGLTLSIYFLILPSSFTLAGTYPLAFLFEAVGIAMFSSFTGAIVGIALNVLLEADFLDRYMRGE